MWIDETNKQASKQANKQTNNNFRCLLALVNVYALLTIFSLFVAFLQLSGQIQQQAIVSV